MSTMFRPQPERVPMSTPFSDRLAPSVWAPIRSWDLSGWAALFRWWDLPGPSALGRR